MDVTIREAVWVDKGALRLSPPAVIRYPCADRSGGGRKVGEEEKLEWDATCGGSSQYPLTDYDECSRVVYDMCSSRRRGADMGKQDYELGEAELAVLRALWDGGPQTVRDVMARLHERGRKVAYTTVLTFLSRLEQKGYVGSDKREQAYVYRSKVSRDNVTRSRVRSLLDQLYDGAAGPMVLQLIENERLSSDEITRLRAMIDDLDQGVDKDDGTRGRVE